MAERGFGRPAKSRFAFGDREAAALRADLEFAGLPNNHSIMRVDGRGVFEGGGQRMANGDYDWAWFRIFRVSIGVLLSFTSRFQNFQWC